MQVDLATDDGVDAVYHHLEETGRSVDAVALNAGVGANGAFATDTEFFERADMLDTKIGAGDKDDPADVAREGFEALMAGKERAVSASMSTKLQGRGSRLLPDSAQAAMHRSMAEPGSAKKD